MDGGTVPRAAKHREGPELQSATRVHRASKRSLENGHNFQAPFHLRRLFDFFLRLGALLALIALFVCRIVDNGYIYDTGIEDFYLLLKHGPLFKGS